VWKTEKGEEMDNVISSTTALMDMRTSRGLTIGEVSRRTGITPGAIRNWEDGRTDGMRISHARKLAAVYGVTADEIACSIGCE
jgi:transcriptional regulator with XRE-family HTH domain